MLTEWIRDWGKTPYTKEFLNYMQWYGPEIERIRKHLRADLYKVELA